MVCELQNNHATVIKQITKTLEGTHKHTENRKTQRIKTANIEKYSLPM
jgi:hypothetical protein